MEAENVINGTSSAPETPSSAHPDEMVELSLCVFGPHRKIKGIDHEFMKTFNFVAPWQSNIKRKAIASPVLVAVFCPFEYMLRRLPLYYGCTSIVS